MSRVVGEVIWKDDRAKRQRRSPVATGVSRWMNVPSKAITEFGPTAIVPTALILYTHVKPTG
jgi:hypothetical protein